MSSPSENPSDALLGQVMQLLTSAEAVAAVGAELARSVEGTKIPDSVAPRVARVAALAAPALAQASVDQRRATLGAIRAIFRQAADLLSAPERAPGWTYDDPSVLDEQGRASGAFGPVLADVLERLGPPLAGRRCVLDVGTGAGWLSIALARCLPGAEVVGIDIWPPALARARQNVVAEGLEARVRIVEQNVLALREVATFDAVWLPGPFLPGDIVAPALVRVRSALRSGGLVCFGSYAGPEHPLAVAVGELRTARSGGHPYSSEEVVRLLGDAGFVRPHEVPRTWKAPLRLVVAGNP